MRRATNNAAAVQLPASAECTDAVSRSADAPNESGARKHGGSASGEQSPSGCLGGVAAPSSGAHSSSRESSHHSGNSSGGSGGGVGGGSSLAECARTLAAADAAAEKKANGLLSPSKLVFQLSRYGLQEYRMMERDRAKYLLYYAAVRSAVRAINARLDACATSPPSPPQQQRHQTRQQQPQQQSVNILVAGAGMGPLVAICEDVVRESGLFQAATIVACDGNPFAVAYLRDKFSNRAAAEAARGPGRRPTAVATAGAAARPACSSAAPVVDATAASEATATAAPRVPSVDVAIVVIPETVVLRPGMHLPASLASRRRTFHLCVSEVLGAAGCNEFFPEIDSLLRAEFLLPSVGVAVPASVATLGALGIVGPREPAPAAGGAASLPPQPRPRRRLGAVSTSVAAKGTPRSAGGGGGGGGGGLGNGSDSRRRSSRLPRGLCAVDWECVQLLAPPRTLWTHRGAGQSTPAATGREAATGAVEREARDGRSSHAEVGVDGEGAAAAAEAAARCATSVTRHGTTHTVRSVAQCPAVGGHPPAGAAGAAAKAALPVNANAVVLGFRATLFGDVVLDTFDMHLFSWEAGVLPLPTPVDVSVPHTVAVSRHITSWTAAAAGTKEVEKTKKDGSAAAERTAVLPEPRHDLWYEWAVYGAAGTPAAAVAAGTPPAQRSQTFVLR